jgi:hypothetical protein
VSRAALADPELATRVAQDVADSFAEDALRGALSAPQQPSGVAL